MAAKRDLYEVLGISKTADEKTIKQAVSLWVCQHMNCQN